MKLINLWLWLLIYFFIAPAQAAPTQAAQTPQIPAPPVDLPVRGYILVDFNSGKTLAELKADERVEPASLTKVITAYTVFRELAAGHIHLTDQVLISPKSWRTGGSKMFVEVGKQVGVEDLLKGMIIQSGNDASVALAEHVAGSEEAFANLMNEQIKKLGITNSHFTNPDGLPDPNLYSTARDMSTVARALIQEFPNYYAWYSNRDFTYHGITQQNRNPLLSRDPTADGVKTGHTKAAGYCLVGSAKRGEMRLISVVMGAPNPNARAEASLALLNYGFRFYESHRLYPAGQALTNLRVLYGDKKELSVGPAADVFATIPRGTYEKLSAHIEKEPTLNAPIEQGAQVGMIIVQQGESEVTRVPLIALHPIVKGNLWRRAQDRIFHN